MRLLFAALIGIFGFNPSTFATSTLKKEDQVTALSDCRVRGKFTQVVRHDTRIYWRFLRISGDCAELGSSFEVFIPPAQWHEKMGQAIYPQFIDEPEAGVTYILKLTHIENDWHLTRFSDGITLP